MNTITSNVYRWVVDDVIAKMKPEVVQEGLDESVLDELRTLWEAKLIQKGLLDTDEPAGQGASGSHPPMPSASTFMAAAGAASFTAQLAALGALPNVGVKREAPETGFNMSGAAAQKHQTIPQQDGAGEEEEEDDDEGEGAEEEGAKDEAADDEVLSSDSEEEEEEETGHEHFLCCQFEKVSRTKNKWKIVMKEGVFHINGKDYLFKRAQGEWIF